MMKKLFVFVLVAVLAYLVQNAYRHYLLKSAVIFMKTKGDVDLNSLQIMSQTDSVYKVLYNVDSHVAEMDENNSSVTTKWDHIVFGHSFTNDDIREQYISAIQNLPFVEGVDVVVTIPWYFPAHIVFNVFVRTWRVVGGWLGKLPKRPLEKSPTPVFTCTEEMQKDMEPVVVFNIFNITDSNMFGSYAKVMFTEIYPTMGANIYFTGDPAGDRWNEINMMAYPSHSSWCEAVQSKIVHENDLVKKKSTADPLLYVAKRLE